MRILDIEKLQVSVDNKSGCVVLHDDAGDIKLIVPNGKMRVERLGTECNTCTTADLLFARKVSNAVYTEDVARSTRPKPKRVCGFD